MKIIKFLELDEKAEILKEKEYETKSNIKLKVPSVNHFQEDEKINISGEWLVIDEILKITNKYIVNLLSDKMTWIKLPEKYVEENYMIDYESDDECPLFVDALIREDGYPIGVITGCSSIKQAKVNNNLDGHKYKGELGIKLNDDYFLLYDKKDERFKLVKTYTDWDRGERTI